MRNLKKIIAVALTLVMLLGVAGIAASAEVSVPTISLRGKEVTNTTTEANGGYYELAVHFDDSSTNNILGIEGFITYEPNVFEYAGVTLNNNFRNAGNPDTSVIVEDGDGKLKFVGLTNLNTEGEWFVLKFTVKAEGKATFAFEDVRGANAYGYKSVTAVNEETEAMDAATNDILKLEGATIRKTADADKQDIRYQVLFDSEMYANNEKYSGYNVVELGVLMMFTRRLNYRELTVDMIDKNETGLAVARVAAEEGKTLEMPERFYAHLNNMEKSILGTRVTARAYIKVSNGDDVKTIYSQNCNAEYETSSGYAGKSVIGVAKKAARYTIDYYKNNTPPISADGWAATTNSIENLLTATETKATSDDEKQTLLGFVNAYFPMSTNTIV